MNMFIGEKLKFKYKIVNGEYLLGRKQLPKFKCHSSFVFHFSASKASEKESTKHNIKNALDFLMQHDVCLW